MFFVAEQSLHEDYYSSVTLNAKRAPEYSAPALLASRQDLGVLLGVDHFATVIVLRVDDELWVVGLLADGAARHRVDTVRFGEREELFETFTALEYDEHALPAVPGSVALHIGNASPLRAELHDGWRWEEVVECRRETVAKQQVLAELVADAAARDVGDSTDVDRCFPLPPQGLLHRAVVENGRARGLLERLLCVSGPPPVPAELLLERRTDAGDAVGTEPELAQGDHGLVGAKTRTIDDALLRDQADGSATPAKRDSAFRIVPADVAADLGSLAAHDRDIRHTSGNTETFHQFLRKPFLATARLSGRAQLEHVRHDARHAAVTKDVGRDHGDHIMGSLLRRVSRDVDTSLGADAVGGDEHQWAGLFEPHELHGPSAAEVTLRAVLNVNETREPPRSAGDCRRDGTERVTLRDIDAVFCIR